LRIWCLDLGPRVAGGNRLGEAGQVVHAGDKDVLDTPVLQVIPDAQPELGRLVLPYPHAKHILVAVEVDPDNQVGCLVDNGPVLLDLEVGRIQENDGIDARQRPILPLFHQR
jgi:hypothetical protein